eukprot:COSAG01_NODE_7426_length_3213_cov_20.062620_4_plen_78_part_00
MLVRTPRGVYWLGEGASRDRLARSRSRQPALAAASCWQPRQQCVVCEKEGGGARGDAPPPCTKPRGGGGGGQASIVN